MNINFNFKVMNKCGRFSYNSHILQISSLSSQQNQSPLPVCLLFGQLASVQSVIPFAALITAYPWVHCRPPNHLLICPPIRPPIRQPIRPLSPVIAITIDTILCILIFMVI